MRVAELKHEGMTMLIAAPEQIFTEPRRADTQRFLSRLLAANRL